MGVELYLIKPLADGRVIYPIWDEDGNYIPGVDSWCIASLKWATWQDPEGRLASLAIGLRDEPIPPEELLAGLTLGFESLLDEIGQIHHDFRAIADAVRGDLEGQRGWLTLFVREEVPGGDEAAQQAAARLVRGPFGSFCGLYEKILEGAREGRHACWSF
jgi:hypothetical protein